VLLLLSLLSVHTHTHTHTRVRAVQQPPLTRRTIRYVVGGRRGNNSPLVTDRLGWLDARGGHYYVLLIRRTTTDPFSDNFPRNYHLRYVRNYPSALIIRLPKGRTFRGVHYRTKARPNVTESTILFLPIGDRFRSRSDIS